MAGARGKNSPCSFDLSDKGLITYLKRTKRSIAYLSDESKDEIANLNCNNDLNQQRALIQKLWPRLLTDALKRLKRSDPREWTDGSGIDFDSFFNRDSLGVEQLTKVLDAFSDFESLMYGARPTKYRDHISHTFRVWIIGQKLLRHNLLGSLRADEHLADMGKKCFPIAGEEWACMWAIAALCHDIGYPLTALEHINERTKDALRPQGLKPLGDLRFAFSTHMQPFYDTIIRLMSSKAVQATDGYLTHLQNKYYLKLLNSFDLQKHGVVSSLILGKSLVYFLESDFNQDDKSPLKEEDARQFIIRREILRAIGAHTCPEIYHLRFDSLSFLLFMVDELQCWGRPTFEQLQQSGAGSEDDGVDIKEFDAKRISITVAVSGAWTERKKSVLAQLNGIRRRLRLAVDSPRMKDLFLRFQVESKGQSKDHYTLLLDRGKISLGAV